MFFFSWSSAADRPRFARDPSRELSSPARATEDTLMESIRGAEPIWPLHHAFFSAPGPGLAPADSSPLPVPPPRPGAPATVQELIGREESRSSAPADPARVRVARARSLCLRRPLAHSGRHDLQIPWPRGSRSGAIYSRTSVVRLRAGRLIFSAALPPSDLTWDSW